MNRIKITRQELYDQVWSQPTLHVARKYGLSDVGLAKLCKRHSIPKPPRGYWAKKEAGQTVKQLPLPKVESDNAEIVFHIAEEGQLKHSGLREQVDEMVDSEAKLEAKISVAKTLRGAHPLVSATNEELAGAKRDDFGFLERPARASLNVKVTKKQLHRSLLILDAVLKALIKRGYKISSGPTATIFEEEVAFGIQESTKTIREQSDDQSLEGSYEFRFNRYNSKTMPSGRLTLFIPDGERFWASGCRRQWRDGKKQKLEDILNKFVSGIVEIAARKREHTLEVERRRVAEIEAAERRAEQAKRREELIRLQNEEQTRLDRLLKQVKNWHTSRNIRQFVEDLRTAFAEAGQEIVPESETGQWLEWALMHADRFDPSIASPPSILDEKVPEEPRRW